MANKKIPPFSVAEKRDIILYVLGIMCYKFALESYTGTISSLALDRFPVGKRFFYKGFLDGFNQAAQCVGSIAVAPLMRRFRIKNILAVAIAMFAVISSLGMIIEGATGGKPPQDGRSAIAGKWDARIIIPIFVAAGFSHGTVELIRRVIPRDIVGGDVVKLKRMDAIVHIFYEVAGTSGAFFSAFIQLEMGKAYAPVVTPFLFAIAAVIWSRIRLNTAKQNALEGIDHKDVHTGLHAIGAAFASFGYAIYKGGQIIFSDRKFSWLLLGYSLPLFLHRYLENGLAQNYAKLILDQAAYGQIIVGGSNFGELIGAAFVLAFSTAVKTPLPWLRLDALTLSITWVLWKADPSEVGNLQMAWILAGIFVFISSGWAAGDCSLSAFIQSNLSRMNNTDPRVSPLGAVMAFLYVSYIITFAILNPVLGNWLDSLWNTQGEAGAREYFFWIGGVFYSLCGVVIMAATFIPRGSFALNPKLDDYDREEENDVDTANGEKHPNKNQEMIEEIVAG
ncbi:uncharacterized protein SPPG_07575 [Spizellomyces punctatus DAOM BR117]|uniref:Major facilitator superfamily (MFS) profile domain-containing protein n=1 Tax=Spizellomyces punctatus (strain DAOM BR117) TaxID=645134 RepID=A0A0L0H7J1_SPIPD|nr:uncharacterized protein SPPG_07575 [Spizellomyces punctatus DAOM BR117]KNC97187.1 hypothetical protein SPPG_07575 [Spizellomyces punctatus DAOM BR117]|eukprot:XP_016605227.1 hypothetical protein SPPG_07575 [Spizellomyces punctatus DAOM BR117]